jgi:hypothetical protein
MQCQCPDALVFATPMPCKVCISTAMSLHGSTCSSDASLDCNPLRQRGYDQYRSVVKETTKSQSKRCVEKWQRIHQKSEDQKKERSRHERSFSPGVYIVRVEMEGYRHSYVNAFVSVCESGNSFVLMRGCSQYTHRPAETLSHCSSLSLPLSPSLSLSHHLCVTTSICPLSLSHHLSLALVLLLNIFPLSIYIYLSLSL